MQFAVRVMLARSAKEIGDGVLGGNASIPHCCQLPLVKRYPKTEEEVTIGMRAVEKRLAGWSTLRSVRGQAWDGRVAFSIRAWPWIPGAVVASGLWIRAYVGGDYAEAAQRDIDLLWQSLGSGILAADPIGSLRGLHIQPPLVNTLFAVDLAISPSMHLFLLLVNLAATVASIALLVDSLVRIGVSRVLSGTAGVLLALLPGTIAYSLWVYNVTLTGFFAITAIWGVALARSLVVPGITVSAVAALGLVLTRSTFAIPVLIAWVLALAWLAWRARARPALVSLGVVLLLGLGVQAHYLASFGQVTMSSWGGQNVLNAARTSGVLTVTPAARGAVAADSCSSAALEAFEENRLNLWDPGGLLALPECGELAIPEPRGVVAWDEQFKPGSQELNLNWRYGLAASGVWAGIAVDVVRGDPLQLARMALAPPAGVQASGVARYLSRSENYPWVVETAESLPFASVGSAYSTVFAPVAWLAVILGWIGAAASRRWRRSTHPAFWFGSALLVFHISASTLLEYAEAMRFRAEVEPVLMFVAVGSVGYGVQWWRQRARREIAVGTSPGSEWRSRRLSNRSSFPRRTCDLRRICPLHICVRCAWQVSR